MTLQRVDELKEPPVVGKRYLVPHVLYAWIGGRKPRHWPVIGPKHEDAEHLGFDPLHYHVDGRFVPQRFFTAAGKYTWRGGEQTGEWAVATYPLCRRGEIHPTVEYRAAICKRAVQYPQTEGAAPFQKFWNKFADKPCTRDAKGLLICPHKGAPLSGIAPDADGHITCPLHGLRFTRDGQPVPRTTSPGGQP